ncbi:3-keto-5-aminohexanoate cleavage protein, partial [Salmonella enterica]
VMDCDDMIRQLMLMVHQIRKIDPDPQFLVCAAGRATMYMTTLATMMGFHIRVGTEDTAFKYPNSNEKFKSNVEMVRAAKQIAELHGR